MTDTSLAEGLPSRLRRLDLAALRDYGVVVAFVALFITLSLSSDVFLTTQNMKNLAFQTAPVGIIAVGGTLVFIAGGFDLSVGAISGYAGITAAQAFNSTGVGLWGAMHPRRAGGAGASASATAC